jgi:L-ribulose-5-phosphate 4-epimerase
MAANVDDLRRELLETARRVTASGVLSLSGHGNLSLRVPGRDEILFTAGGSLRDLPPQAIVRLRLDGELLEGEVAPMANAVIHMHTAVYQELDDVNCVLHTHSPWATAFAVANRAIECWTEAMAIFGLGEGVPVAAYGPRGSEVAIANIREVLAPGRRAVLLANHGILAFHRSATETVGVNVVLEETAQSAVYAGAVGGPTVIPPHMIEASRVRAEDFVARGPARAAHG